MANLGLIPDRDRVTQIGEIYAKSQKYITEQIFSIDALNYSDVQANKIKRNIELEIQRLNLNAMVWSKVAIPEAYYESKKSGDEVFQKANMKKDRSFNRDIHQKTIDMGIDQVQKDLLKSNRSIMPQIIFYLSLLKKASKSIVRGEIQELDSGDATAVNKIITAGIEEHETVREMSKTITQYFKNQFQVGNYIKINNRNYNIKKYSEMVARTQMRTMQSVATRNICKEYNNDLVAWSDHYQRVPDIECTPYAGRVFSWSGKSTKFAKIPAIPPTHPRCEHYLTPVPEVLIKIEPDRFKETKGFKFPEIKQRVA